MISQFALVLGCVAVMKPHSLTVEYRENPVGMDVATPRFSWKPPEGTSRQSAYEIDAGFWRTGKVVSDESLNAATWGGAPLRPSQRVRWRVRVWDENGRVGDWSDPEMFLAIAAILPSGSHPENPDGGIYPQAIHFTDYASAGDLWRPDCRFRVWLPELVPGRNY